MKMLFICNGDELSLRSQKMLDILNAQYPEMEVERMNIKDMPTGGDMSYTQFFIDEMKTMEYHHKWNFGSFKRKPKPFYRQGECW